MTPDEYAEMQELFLAARDLPNSDRDRYLRSRCAGRAPLLMRIRHLLAASESNTGFLEDAALGSDFSLMNETPAAATSELDVGQTVGRYRIERLLAKGGMGAIYLAHQEEPARRVVLKVLRQGATSAARLERLRDEAQVLGRLQHPGIAQIFEAGSEDFGAGVQPYFAMEYVDGATLTEFGVKAGLSRSEKLQLLAAVCDAVQHAHQHGVVHQDLKPANVLVDASGLPRVIDFGIARTADHGPEAAETPSALVGTLPYMSPEQLRGAGDVDTRSDVYALGLLCYELITGSVLQSAPDGVPLAVARDAMLQQSLQPFSERNSRVQGDLAWVLQRALAADPEERYPSASMFAEDLRRICAKLPVAARPATLYYLLRKGAQRNRWATAAAAVALLAVTVGLIGTTLGLMESWRQQQAAEEARIESEEVTRFFEEMLVAVEPERLGRDVLVRDVLDQTAQRFRGGSVRRGRIEARLQHALGAAYVSLGVHDEAHWLLQEALAIRVEVLGEAATETMETRRHFATLLHKMGHLEEAHALHSEQLQLEQQLFGGDHVETVATTVRLANVCIDRSRFDAAAALLEPLVARRAAVTDRVQLQATAALGRLRQQQGQFDESMLLYERAMAAQQSLLGPANPDTLSTMTSLAVVYRRLGRVDAAERIYQQVLAARREIFGDAHPKTLTVMNNLGRLYHHTNRLTEAEELLVAVLDGRRSALTEDHPETLLSKNNLAGLYMDLDKLPAAEALFREVLHVRLERDGERHLDTLRVMTNLASVCQRRGRPQEAEALFLRALSIQEAWLGDQHPHTIFSLSNLAKLYCEDADFTAAAPLVERARRAAPQVWKNPRHLVHGVLFLRHGEVLQGTGRRDEARAAFSSSLEILLETVGPDDKRTKAASAALGSSSPLETVD
ncbi:MAG: serine/threonine-protein kinase [Planctomycetota bacterium]